MDTIYYLLTSESPLGCLHRNRSDITHFLHLGGTVHVPHRIVVGRADRVPSWARPRRRPGAEDDRAGGYWKTSFLAPGVAECLISEAVVPAFDYARPRARDCRGASRPSIRGCSSVCAVHPRGTAPRRRRAADTPRACSASSTASSWTPPTRTSPSSTRACCAATASSRSCASTRAARSARRAPRADGPQRRSRCGCRSTPTWCAPTPTALLAAGGAADGALRLVVTRGGRRIGILEPLPTLPRDDRAGDDHLLADARARRRQVAVLRREHARDAPGAASRAPTRRCSSARTGACSRARRRRSSTSSTARLYTPPLSGPHPRLDHAPRAARGHRRERAGHDARRPRRRSSEAFLASSLREVQPVRSIDGARAPAGARAALDARRRRARARAHRRRLAADVVKVVTVIGNRPQFVKAAAVSGPLRADARGAARPHRPALRRRAVDDLRRRARRAARRRSSWSSAAARTPSRPRACSAALGRPAARRARPTPCSSTATRTRRSPARSPPRRRGSRSPTSRPGMRSFDRAMPEELNRVADRSRLATCCSCPRRPRPTNLARESASRARSRSSATSWSTSRALLAPRARADDAPLRAAGVAAGRVRARHRAPRRQRRRSRSACARLVELLLGSTLPARPAAAPAHPRAAGGGRAARARSQAGTIVAAAARLPRVHRRC